jgi:hypothetical protein
MNELIKQLWEDSEEIKVRYPEQGSPVSVSEQTLEKFTELIVRECIDVLDGKIYRASDHEGDETWPDLILKEHFGVTE